MDAQMGMSTTKPGDQSELSTITYVNEQVPQAFRMYGQGGARRQNQCVMFEPKPSTTAQLLTLDNPSKELSFIINHEYNLLREKQEMKAHQAELLKAKEQE